MNSLLREACARFIKGSSSLRGLEDIQALNPSVSDFGDDLFESFDVDGKLLLCSMLPLLCPKAADQIIEHRRVVETNEESRRFLDYLIRVRREKRGEDEFIKCFRNYPERTCEQRFRLKGLVTRYLAHRGDVATSLQIQDLAPTDNDFSDEFLDSFGPEARREIYLTLLMWCGPYWLRKILERRAKTETDQACKLFVKGILSDVRKSK